MSYYFDFKDNPHMTTTYVSNELIAADRFIVKRRIGGLTKRYYSSKMFYSECKRLAMVSQGALLTQSLVDLISNIVLSILLEKGTVITPVRIASSKIGADNWNIIANVIGENPVPILTSAGLYQIDLLEDQSKGAAMNLRKMFDNHEGFFGTGAYYASAAMLLTDDLKEVFELTALCDDLTSAEFDVVRREDLKPIEVSVV